MRVLAVIATLLIACRSCLTLPLDSIPVQAFAQNGSRLAESEFDQYDGLYNSYRFHREAYSHVVGVGSKILEFWQPYLLESVGIHIYAARKFISAHPEYSVRINNVGWDNVQFGDMTCTNATITCPSVILLGTTQFASRFEQGDIADLSTFFDDYAVANGKVLTDDFLKYYFYSLARAGSWLAVPLTSDTRIMYFNKTTFNAIKMPYPAPWGPAWSWETFAKNAVVLHNKTGYEAFLFREGSSTAETLITLSALHDYRASLYRKDALGVNVCAMNKNNALEKFYRNVLKPLLLDTGMKPSSSLFANGTYTHEFVDWLATNYTVTDLQPQFKGPLYDFIEDKLPGFAIIPPAARNLTYTDLEVAFVPGTFSFLGGSALIVSSHVNETQQALAWELVLSMVELVDEYAYNLNSPPPYDSILTQKLWQGKNWTVITGQVKKAVPASYPQVDIPIVGAEILAKYIPVRHAWMDMKYKKRTPKDAAIYTSAAIDEILKPVCTIDEHSDPLCNVCTSGDFTPHVSKCSTRSAKRYVTFAQNRECLPFDDVPQEFALLCNFIALKSGNGATIFALTLALSIIAFACVLKLFTMDETTSLRIAQPFLLMSLCAATIIMTMSNILHINQNNCVGWLLTVTIGFDCALGCIFSRVYRVMKVFRPLMNDTIRSSTTFLRESLIIVATVALLDFVLIIAWTSSTTYGRHTEIKSIQGILIEDASCGSTSSIWSTVFIAFKLVCLCVTSYIAFIMRNVSDTLVDAKATMYTAFNYTIIFLFLVVLLLSGPEETLFLVLKSYAILLMGVVPLLTLVLPRIFDNIAGRNINILTEVQSSSVSARRQSNTASSTSI